MWTYNYADELCHFGIKGQKWGVRRYQNKDGSLTNTGSRRYSENNEKKRHGISKSTAKKIAAGVTLAGGVALTAYAMKNPNARKFLAENSSKVLSSLKNAATSEKTKNFIKDNSTKAVKSLGDSTKKAGKAMTEAALVTVGTIKIDQIAARYADKEGDSEATKNRNLMIRETTSAGIRSATGASGGTNNSSSKSGNKGGNVGADITNKLGTPSKTENAKQNPQYNTLFKDKNGNQRSEEVRQTIKSLASAGYSVDQIREYTNGIDNGSIKHSDDSIRWMATVIAGKDFLYGVL